MQSVRGIVHTLEIQLYMSTDYIDDNVDLKIFERPDNSVGKYLHICEGFNTTLRFINPYRVSVYVKIDLFALTSLRDTDESNYDLIFPMIQSYFCFMFDMDARNIAMNRIDFCFDFSVDEFEKKGINNLLEKKVCAETHQYKRNDELIKSSEYEGSIYFNGNRRQLVNAEKAKTASKPYKFRKQAKKLLIYDKEKQSPGISEYLNNRRFEVTLNRAALRYNSKKNGIDDTLERYLNTDMAKEVFLKEYGKILLRGNYYKADKAKQKILASNLSKEKENKLMKFIDLLIRLPYAELKLIIDNKISKKKKGKEKLKYIKMVAKELTPFKFRSYIQQLETLGINPILLDRDFKLDFMQNPLELVAKI